MRRFDCSWDNKSFVPWIGERGGLRKIRNCRVANDVEWRIAGVPEVVKQGPVSSDCANLEAILVHGPESCTDDSRSGRQSEIEDDVVKQKRQESDGRGRGPTGDGRCQRPSVVVVLNTLICDTHRTENPKSLPQAPYSLIPSTLPGNPSLFQTRPDMAAPTDDLEAVHSVLSGTAYLFARRDNARHRST
nr:hypothetical protein CFP56_08050 [Quercus suber]